MSIFVLAIGLGLATAIMVDLVGSTFLPSQFRFIAYAVERGVWRLFAGLSDRLHSQRLRTYAGPVILFSVFVTWIGGAWIAWTIVFLSSPDAVVTLVGSGSGSPASFWDRAYYVGGLLSTLGVGDFTSGTPFWRMLSVVASLIGLTIVTLSISNFVTVVFALSETRALAGELSSLGLTGRDMLCAGWDGKTFAPLLARLDSILSRIFLHAERAAAFGMVNRFVYAERHRAIAPAIAALDDALVLLSVAVAEEVRPHPLVILQFRRAIDVVVPTDAKRQQAPWPVADAVPHLRALDVPLAPDGAENVPIDGVMRRRERLAGWLNGNGWTWDLRPALRDENRS